MAAIAAHPDSSAAVGESAPALPPRPPMVRHLIDPTLWPKSPWRDARHAQILVLSSLLLYGGVFLGFEVHWWTFPVIAGSAMAADLTGQVIRRQRLDVRSALISSLSLTIVLRADHWLLLAAAGVLATASKHVLRIDDRHVFNPANFAIIVAVGLAGAWIDTGQWGSFAPQAFAFVACAVLVLTMAARFDIAMAFFGSYAGLLFVRHVLWLGDPMAIWVKQLKGGALLLFTFFMITDPRTTPFTRRTRIAFGVAVGVLAYGLQFTSYQQLTAHPLWALFLLSPLVPLINRWERRQGRVPGGTAPGAGGTLGRGTRLSLPLPPGPRQPAHTPTPPACAHAHAARLRTLTRRPPAHTSEGARPMRPLISLASACALGAAALLSASPAAAFCGFFVAKADAELYNKATQVVLARHGDFNAITMASDYQGPLNEFAMVVPVPVVLAEDDIAVLEPRLIQEIDAYSAPRLVEYFDEDPCAPLFDDADRALVGAMAAPEMAAPAGARAARALGVTIEAEYQIGEYDILILSAQQSDGLATWLTQNGYRIPDGAGPILDSYLRQDMKFFVAKVNLEQMNSQGRTMLRPIQVRYESPKFMLPVRLGTVNADGPQELLIYALSNRGQIRPVNYRTVKLPTDLEIPVYVKNDFGAFYNALFDQAVAQNGMNAVYLEYAWDSGTCDPCAAPPMAVADLATLGATWVSVDKNAIMEPVFISRLHVRYTADSLPEDLMFQVTNNTEQFQGRYVLRHTVDASVAGRCQRGQAYLESLPRRHQAEAQTLARLTGWNLSTIRADMEENGQSFAPPSFAPPGLD